jgi:hypothetical protein
VSFAAITPYVASQRVFIVVSIYFVIESIRKLLDTPSYKTICKTVLFYILIFKFLERTQENNKILD